jgi:hypothetical protein
MNMLRVGVKDLVFKMLKTIFNTKLLTISLDELNCKVNQLNTVILNLKSLKDVKNADYPNLTDSVDFYIKNSELLKGNTLKLNKLLQAAQSSNGFYTN